MKVEVIEATPNPMDVVSRAAGTCYGKDDSSAKRVKSCFNAGHMSVFEHVSATFKVDGISRACSHQLVRHRIASYSQQSQRYCRIDVGGDWYVKPPSFKAGEDVDPFGMEPDEFFHACMADAARNYRDALEAGMKPEDARYLLPESAKTSITVTMNSRELFHFLDLRLDRAAQWEIRELAQAMLDAISARDGQWGALMALRGGR